MINDKNIFTLFSPVSSTFGRKPFVLSQNTCDESKFRKDLQQTKNEHRTSSPTDFKSFIQSSVHADGSDFQTSQAHTPLEVKGKCRLTHFRAVKKKQICLFEPFHCRSKKAPGRDCLPTGQEDSVPYLPGP